MKIKNIKIKDFKSIYGEQYFDFETMEGLVKLSGIIGSGKTTVGEAILWGLYGKIKEHKNGNLIAWHMRSCEIEINLTSKNKDIYIKRSTHAPLEIYINGKLLAASNKRDTQEILEEEYFDVPALAIQKMCIISFNAFNNSLCSMSAGETRLFLDEIFGFKTFTEYNDEIISERKVQITENTQLNAILLDTKTQIEHLLKKKKEQQAQLSNSIDIDKLNNERTELVDKGVSLKNELNELSKSFDLSYTTYVQKMSEVSVLGKQEKQFVTTFSTGKCPTCGHDIDVSLLEKHKQRMQEYANKYRELELESNTKKTEYINNKTKIDTKISDIKKRISEIDSSIKLYNNNLKLISENYDDIISEYNIKIEDISKQISESDKNIGEWNEMNELFSKTLRYGLLDTLIPHINKSIKYYMNKLGQEYTVEYDKEFKPHIYIENNDNEISYRDLSTGQKKTLDIAIIFGVIQNVIANVDFNIFFLDELFSNMDADSRYTMLNLLKDNLCDNRAIFVVNHAEMPDDFFAHKIRVSIVRKRVEDYKKKEDVIVNASKYEKIF